MPYRGTLGDVDALARRVAAGLRARGIEPGDAVAFQLPNWLEAAATFYAIAYLGAVVVPIVHFYGPKEVGYILRKTQREGARSPPTASATRTSSRTSPACATTLPDLEWVAVVGDARARRADPRDLAFADLVADEPLADDPGRRPACARARRVHVGHHVGPEGRRALAPHDQRRDPSARGDAGRIAAARR